MRIVHQHDEMGEIKKGPWKAEEDEVLINHVKKYGSRDWSSIRSKGLLQRTGKSCRLRWVNKLRPDLKNGVKFTAEEERTVIDLQAQIGNKWATIATYLKGRTDNDVKNFWSSRQKRLSRILHNSTPSMSKSYKNNTKEFQAPESNDVPSFEKCKSQALKFSPSVDDEPVKNSETYSSSHVHEPEMIKMVPHPGLAYTSLLNEPFFEPPSHLMFPPIPPLQPEFPMLLEGQAFNTRLGDSTFSDLFGQSSCSALGTEQLPIVPAFFVPGEGDSHNAEALDSFIDNLPPIDMFDHIEPLPSPSKWS